MTMKYKHTVGIFMVFVALVEFVVMEFLRGPRGLISGFDRGIHANWEKIPVGIFL